MEEHAFITNIHAFDAAAKVDSVGIFVKVIHKPFHVLPKSYEMRTSNFVENSTKNKEHQQDNSRYLDKNSSIFGL